jgi:hypothetical protein
MNVRRFARFFVRTNVRQQAEKTAKRRGGEAPPPQAETTPAAPRPQGVTTFRLFADQLQALGQVAAARKWASGAHGKADQSAVLRDLLDAIAAGGEVPRDLRDALVAARGSTLHFPSTTSPRRPSSSTKRSRSTGK